MSLFVAIATATAFTAATIEGISVLDEAQKRRSDEERSNLSPTTTSSEVLFFPTLAYSVISLPLSVIGASPSLYLISKLTTLHPHLRDVYVKDHSNFQGISPSVTTSSSTNVILPHRRMKLDATTKTSNYNDNAFERNQFTVKQKRKENRQILEAIKERKEKDVATQKIFKDCHSSQTTRNFFQNISSYVETLDGSPLPTALAESMRRVRILAFGCGLMSALFAYQLQSKDNSKLKETNEPKQSIIPVGKESKSIEDFIRSFDQMTHTNHNSYVAEGVAIRLFHNYNELTKFSRNFSAKLRIRNKINSLQDECCIIPIPTFAVKENMTYNDRILNWCLGHTQFDWNALPLSKRWLFQTDKIMGQKKANPFILLETNLICCLQESIEAFDEWEINRLWRNKKEEIFTHESLVEAQKVKQIALSKLSQDDGNYQVGVVNVIIGSGIGQNYALIGEEDSNQIYINGLNALAGHILKEVQSACNSTPLMVETTNANITSSSETNDSFHSVPIQLIDGLGRYIRLSGQILLNQISKKLANVHLQQRDCMTIHMYSDSPEIMRWIAKNFPKSKVRINFYFDVDNGVDTSFTKEVTDRDVILLMCSSDAATINFLSRMLEKNKIAKGARCISILENTSSIETFNVISDSFQTNPKPTIICVDSVFDDLFSQVRSMLSNGNSTKEVNLKLKNYQS